MGRTVPDPAVIRHYVMRVIDPGWASRFYGMDVPPDVAAAADEQLTESDHDDLVDAHLAINYAYFGALDKTLSGFVVLDDEGDNYTLFDARDGKQIWWQDHETREVSLRFAREEGRWKCVHIHVSNAADNPDYDYAAIEKSVSAASR